MRSTIFVSLKWTYWLCFKILPCIDFPLHRICVLSTLECNVFVKLWMNSVCAFVDSCPILANQKEALWVLFQMYKVYSRFHFLSFLSDIFIESLQFKWCARSSPGCLAFYFCLLCAWLVAFLEIAINSMCSLLSDALGRQIERNRSLMLLVVLFNVFLIISIKVQLTLIDLQSVVSRKKMKLMEPNL